MRQKEIIGQLTELLQRIDGIQAAVLYGSFGRGDATPNSDIDIQVLINKGLKTNSLLMRLEKAFNGDCLRVVHVQFKDKIVVYLQSCPKVEIQLCTEPNEFDVYFLGSRISNVDNAVLFDDTGDGEDSLTKHLNTLVSSHKPSQEIDDQYIKNLTDKFIYEFENCSQMHRRGDAFHAYFFYNAALHVAIQLKQISLGYSDFNFLPKKMNTEILPKSELEQFYKLRGTLFLPEFNKQKDRLLRFLYEALNGLLPEAELEEVKRICNSFRNRDWLWNFRKIQLHNPTIKLPIYRSSTLSLVGDDAFFTVQESFQIRTIIDLRAEREVKDIPYSSVVQEQVEYINIPFDPWAQPEWFINSYAFGSNDEIAYRFFMVACKSQIVKVMRVISRAADSGMLIHCHAGKDRTGIISTLLHLLAGADEDVVFADYLASEMDTRKELLDIVMETINNHGGVESFLLDCGMRTSEIGKLKMLLTE